jgi:pimeloyl-ACP methyl ester carboxylesterase
MSTEKTKPIIGFVVSLISVIIIFLGSIMFLVLGAPLGGILGILFVTLIIIFARRGFLTTDKKAQQIYGGILVVIGLIVVGLIVMIVIGISLALGLTGIIAGFLSVIGGALISRGARSIMPSTRSQKTSPVRSIVSFAWRWLEIPLFGILGGVSAMTAFFLAAFLFDTATMLFVVAFVVGFLIASGGVWLSVSKMRPIKPRRVTLGALGVGVGAMLLLALVFSLTILQPWPSTVAAQQLPTVPAGVNYWNLSTGSHIAYLEVPAQGVAKATPFIFVGGGPGDEDVADASETQFFGQVAQLGYNVYFYDQVGAGLSARLADPAQYTLARHVADLEAIRAQIGAQQMILLGISWGGTLVANYIAAYPQNVAKAIFMSPGPINWFEWPNSGSDTYFLNNTAKQQVNQMFSSLSIELWLQLAMINPKAALSLVSNQEADAFGNTVGQLISPGLVYDPSHIPNQWRALNGNGFYDGVFAGNNAASIHPKVNPRTILSSDSTPTLIMTGSANFVSWAPTWQYKTTLPNSTLLYFQDAGHDIFLDQPQLCYASIQAFLLGTSLPIQPWTSSQPPSTYQGPP